MLNQGKVAPKQKVLIRFNAYPYKEYGTVITTVDHISPLPETKEDKAAYYEVITYLPGSIMTDYGKHLVCRPNMTAQALIITEDRSLLERIFSQFLSLVKKQNI